MSHPLKNKPKIDMVGFRSGRLLVVSFNSIARISRKALWNCVCDCGNSCIAQQDVLKSGKTRSCGCLRTEMYHALRLEPGLAAKRNVYTYYKQNAQKRGLEFSLEFSSFIEMSQQKCFYCGRDPSNIMKTRSRNGDFIYNGIDRKDPKIGYIIDNCVPCCGRCNEAKMDLTVAQFMDWIGKVYTNMCLWEREREAVKCDAGENG